MCIFQNQFWVSELGVLYVAFKARVVELGLQVFLGGTDICQVSLLRDSRPTPRRKTPASRTWSTARGLDV